MKLFRCTCGQRIFFDNTACVRCGSQLGFDPQSLLMLTLDSKPDGTYVDSIGTEFRYCRNFHEHGVCNWLLPKAGKNKYCLGCERTKLIPGLDVPGNLLLWHRLETAKRRLLYTLLLLRLPLTTSDDSRNMRFRFMEDRRRNPNVFESFISTGHHDGTITINIAEADDVARAAVQEQMHERYRTLLGHFRHESGHYYMPELVGGRGETDNFRSLFGDERTDYTQAVEKYYRDGAPADWPTSYVSPYASSHPHEDWAESFAHYLHIIDALETGNEAGLSTAPEGLGPAWMREWMELSVTLNELTRSLGVEDPYPFILSEVTQEKLLFIDRLVRPSNAP